MMKQSGDSCDSWILLVVLCSLGVRRQPSHPARSILTYCRTLKILPCALDSDIPNTFDRLTEMAVPSLTVRPIQPPADSDIDFGAEIEGANLETLTGREPTLSYGSFD
jgi:hypothetical protein